MKPTKIKAWPELLDFQPGLIVIRESSNSAAHAAVEVDFGSVRTVSSTGLTTFLLRVLACLAGKPPVRIFQDCAKPVHDTLSYLGAFNILANLHKVMEHGELPLQHHLNMPSPTDINHTISLPVYHLRFPNSTARRDVVHQFKVWLFKELNALIDGYSIKPHALIQLIGEIAKNTADHTTADALFGLDLTALPNNCAKLTFAFGDLGEGIKRNIEKHLNVSNPSRQTHWSLYEPYRLALTPGFSSKGPEGENKGHGMNIIIDCANALDAHLSVFDAASRGLLNNLQRVQTPSHSEVRRIFHSVGHNVGFFYYGEVHLGTHK